MKELWINLPVKDVKKSKAFFAELGFTLNPRFKDTDEAAGLIIGDSQIAVMLFPEESFRKFTNHDIADTSKGTEVLISVDAQSREEVDQLIAKAEKAGGTVFTRPEGSGWMYGAGFTDLDGHRWNVLFMDTSKIPSK
ncbi:hypothetical protein FHS18_001794 [Paenibacillus phyllosphaerae]|uniref:VOC domain-containing protein n=1 Tax=Paenibacillus phyllosphaerae TaxID=274593 RepID=A0A7W5AX48_9BACL|nr:VOC family protein [Paenibacillus phyllosphaerae]MBB3109731.1 hypothetical protein [Paenibacillus phyllosphaerae]